jgi:hypothetical protein
VKILYSSLKRLSPKFKWNVNTGSQWEESLASEVIEMKTVQHVLAWTQQ